MIPHRFLWKLSFVAEHLLKHQQFTWSSPLIRGVWNCTELIYLRRLINNWWTEYSIYGSKGTLGMRRPLNTFFFNFMQLSGKVAKMVLHLWDVCSWISRRAAPTCYLTKFLPKTAWKWKKLDWDGVHVPSAARRSPIGINNRWIESKMHYLLTLSIGDGRAGIAQTVEHSSVAR